MSKPKKYKGIEKRIDDIESSPNPDRGKAIRRINEMLEAMKDDIRNNFTDPNIKFKLEIEHKHKNPWLSQTEDIEPDVGKIQGGEF